MAKSVSEAFAIRGLTGLTRFDDCGQVVGEPPVSGKLSAALLFLYFSGGRDRTMIWDIHRNERQLC
jgi:hypothetical protein